MNARELLCNVAAALPDDTTIVIHGDAATGVITVRRRGPVPSTMARLAVDCFEHRPAERLAHVLMTELDGPKQVVEEPVGDAA